jgi:hypothetical protein
LGCLVVDGMVWCGCSPDFGPFSGLVALRIPYPGRLFIVDLDFNNIINKSMALALQDSRSGSRRRDKLPGMARRKKKTMERT